MNSRSSFQPAAVILAGGRSSRLGPGPKAMTTLAGVPMIQHVIEKVKRQADPVLLSVQERQPDTDKFGLVNVPDLVQRHRGPLTGLCSAMQHLVDAGNHEWLLLCPCDAPFIPADLSPRLYEQAISDDEPVSVARYEQVTQPTFSLWNLAVLPQVRDAVINTGRGGLMSMLDHLPHTVVEWQSAEIPPFFNVNTPADLALAQRMLDPGQPTG